MNEIGKLAVIKFGHPPFIDASCRREPDFENNYPSITSICRQGMFAPRLRENDIVVYLSTKRKYYDDDQANNKLIAFLQVDKIFETHQLAFEWYKKNNFPTPSNCMVDNNSPYNFDHTASNFETSKEIKAYLLKSDEDRKRQGQFILRLWDNKYKGSTDKWKMFVKTKPLLVEFNKPISLFKADLETIFGEIIPNTRCGPSIKFHHLEKLALIAGIKLVIK